MKPDSNAKVDSLFLLGIALALAAACGWALNIIKLVGMDLMPVTGMLIARAIGIFVAPLGVVLGYL